MSRPLLTRIPMAAPARLLSLTLKNGGVDWRRAHVFGGLLLRYAAFEPLRVAERLAFDRSIDSHALSAPPIFVLGHWRSGTSYLQTLMALDPRFTTTTLYNTLFADFAGLTQSWLRPALNRTAARLNLPHNLQRQPLSLDLTGEHDVGLFAQMSPHAYTWGHIFPRHFDAWLDRYVLNPSPEDEQAWLDHLDRYVRKLSWLSGGKRVVLKAPGDTGRVAALARRWPDARFVFIHRDPIAVFHSNRYLWSVIRSEFSVQTVTDADVDETIIRTYAAVMKNYLAQREAIPTGQLTEIAYEDLRREPVSGLQAAYDALQLAPLPEPVVRAIGEQPHYAPRSYDTPEALEARLRREWDFIPEEWTR